MSGANVGSEFGCENEYRLLKIQIKDNGGLLVVKMNIDIEQKTGDGCGYE